QRIIHMNGNAVGLGERLNHVAAAVQDFRGKFTGSAIYIDEEVLALELNGPSRKGTSRRAGVHRSEAVTPKHGEAHTRLARSPHALFARAATHVEIQVVADNEADTTCRLDIRVIPISITLGNRNERAAVRTRPVESIAREAGGQFVGFIAIRGLS